MQTLQELNNLLVMDSPLAHLGRVLFILISTWLMAVLAGNIAVRALKSRSLRWRRVDERRLLTLQALVRDAVRGAIWLIGTVAVFFSLGVSGGAILTTLGLFSAAFGLGARPIISDYLTGIILIFEDQFSVGDKVEMLGVVGFVEAVDMRITHIRSETGELYIVPNGDVRVVRNLSRGQFSMATVKVTIATEDLTKALEVLERVADHAQSQLDELVERPEFLSEEGSISTRVELLLSAKAKYGKGARTRTRLMALVTEALNDAGVRIIS
jgi:small conductance mechanosensitive channel